MFIILSLLSSAAAYKSELVLQDPEVIGEVVRSARPKLSAEQLPESWSWQEKGLLTTDLNQHIPVYW